MLGVCQCLIKTRSSSQEDKQDKHLVTYTDTPKYNHSLMEGCLEIVLVFDKRDVIVFDKRDEKFPVYT